LEHRLAISPPAMSEANCKMVMIWGLKLALNECRDNGIRTHLETHRP
jgi:hypothetical protein